MQIGEIIDFLKNVRNRENNPVAIAAVRESLKSIKAQEVKAGNQQEAKKIWCYQQILSIQNYYLKAFGQMRAREFYQAWCSLEQCEMLLGFLGEHFDSEDDSFGLQFINKHTRRYQSLFPYKLFISPEILILEQECSICGAKLSIRRPCGHKAGEIYDGEMCGRIVKKCDYLGTAFVSSPLQKYSVPFPVDEKTGQKVDRYNYAPVEYLVTKVSYPFDSWDVDITKIRMPHSKFSSIGRNDSCPCGSGKKYKKCCLLESGVLRPNYEFTLSKPVLAKLQNGKMR